MTETARKFTAAQRKAAAKSGNALPDGSFVIHNAEDLKNAIGLVGNSKNPKAMVKGHVIKMAKKLGKTKMLPKGWTTEKAYADIATATGITCPECPDRRFYVDQSFVDHAETVHTFDDITRVVSEAVREAYGDPNPESRVWTWVESCATDYVVFSIEKSNDMNLYKADYTLDGTTVTLGDPVQVIRRTVYDPVQNPDPAPVKNAAAVADGQ